MSARSWARPYRDRDPSRSPPASRSTFRRRAVVGCLVLLSLVLITISFRQPSTGAVHNLESAGATVLRPFEVAAERVARPFRDVYGYFRGLVHVKRENGRLKSQLNDLRQQALQGQQAIEQNAKLRQQLRYVDGPQFPADYRGVNTRIISWRASSTSSDDRGGKRRGDPRRHADRDARRARRPRDAGDRKRGAGHAPHRREQRRAGA